MKNLTPIGQQILLRFLPPEDAKPGEIYLGSNSRDTSPARATVVKLGSGRDEKGKLVRFEVKVGDTVLVSRHYPGIELKEDGESYCLVKEEGLLGIVETSSDLS